MTTKTLSIGIPTAGRPDAIRRCLKRIDRVVEYPHEIIILDNTPDVNSHVSYQNATTVLRPEEQIGPGESRKRIANVADTDLLLFLDDDTFPKPDSVSKLVSEIGADCKLVSGVWTIGGALEEGRECGRVFQWGVQNDKRTLIEIDVYPDPIQQRGFESWEVDAGLPTLLVHTDLFNSVTFDPRYDWYFEWLDFFLQTHKQDEQVQVRLDAPFEHAAISYSSSTIRSEQERNRDQRRFLDKWEIELCRSATFGSSSWEQSQSLDRRAAQIYVSGGLTELAKRAKGKLMNLR